MSSQLQPPFLSARFPHVPFCLFLCPCLPQRFVQPTVVVMAFVYRAAAAVMTAGWALGVTRGRVTRAAMNTALARMGNVNAVRDGTESTALLVGWEEGLYGMGLWVCMSLWRDLRVNTNVAGLSACAFCVCVCGWVSVQCWVWGEGLTQKREAKACLIEFVQLSKAWTGLLKDLRLAFMHFNVGMC